MYKTKPLYYVLLFLLISAFVYWRFHHFLPHLFCGDDLYNLFAYYDGAFASTIKESITGTYFEKYRPVFALIMHFLFSFFGGDIRPYLVINILIQSINGLLFFLLSFKMSKNKVLVAGFLTIAFVTSRFAIYQVTQVTGIVESIALTFFLITLYALMEAVYTKYKVSWSWIAIIFLWFAFNTHERYIAIAPILIVVFYVFYRNSQINLKSLILLLLGSFIACGINIFVKIWLLKINFFTGTGGVHLGINYSIIIEHIQEAVFSVLGFNYGPDYLIGKQVSLLYGNSPANIITRLLALVFSGIFIYILARLLILVKKDRMILNGLLLFILLFSSLLFPTLFTIRLEQRWEYELFMFVLLLFAYATGKLEFEYRKMQILSIIICLAVIFIDNWVSESYDQQLFFRWWDQDAVNLKRDIIDSKLSKPGEPLITLVPQRKCYNLQDDSFFRLYEGKRRNIWCVDSDEQFQNLRVKNPGTSVFVFKNNKYELLKN